MKGFVLIIIILTLGLLTALDVEFYERDLGADLTKPVKKSSETIPALSYRGTLLEDHFGVYPTLQSNSGGVTTYSFDWTSLAPTKHTESATWVESDYYGGDTEASAVHGTFPSGGERYDVEALYMDNDNDNIYMAIITSVPHYRDYGSGNASVGIMDSRYSNVWVRSGDISLDLGLGTPRDERGASTWHYNYGVDITHENRDQTTSYGSYPSCDMRDNLLGSELYRTYADAGGSNVINPPTGTSDWHTSMLSGAVEADWEHTNFDPFSDLNTTDDITTPNIALIGDSSDGIVTAYYELAFAGGLEENGQKTYVIEVTIPRSLLGADNPGTGDSVAFRYMPGCRNDGESDIAVVKLTTTIKGFASLGDYVWSDLNQNGIQDDGTATEVGIAGITVNLYDDGSTPLRSTTTDAYGYYNFDNLIPGIYYVEFIKNSWEITTANAGSNDELDSDANPGNGQTGTYTLVIDQHEPSVDCGLFTGDPLPVTLSSFNATFASGLSRLEWTTQSESNNALWNVYRSVSQNSGQSVQVNYESLPGSGTTSEPTNYLFNDYSLNDYIQAENMVNPTIYYWIESVDNSGSPELHGPVSINVINSGEEFSTPEIPDVYGLNQNYPNPFNPDTGISFNLIKDSKASLVVYNVKGEKVKTLFRDKECSKNRTYTEFWNGKDKRGNTVSSGIYLAVLKTDKELFTRKMILQK